jgi:hypothetical protein
VIIQTIADHSEHNPELWDRDNIERAHITSTSKIAHVGWLTLTAFCLSSFFTIALATHQSKLRLDIRIKFGYYIVVLMLVFQRGRNQKFRFQEKASKCASQLLKFPQELSC